MKLMWNFLFSLRIITTGRGNKACLIKVTVFHISGVRLTISHSLQHFVLYLSTIEVVYCTTVGHATEPGEIRVWDQNELIVEKQDISWCNGQHPKIKTASIQGGSYAPHFWQQAWKEIEKEFSAHSAEQSTSLCLWRLLSSNVLMTCFKSLKCLGFLWLVRRQTKEKAKEHEASLVLFLEELSLLDWIYEQLWCFHRSKDC